MNVLTCALFGRAILCRMSLSRVRPPGWARGRGAAVLTALILGVAACGGGDASGGVTTTAPGELPRCADERHVVAFDFFGTITTSDDDLGDWLAVPNDAPGPRTGAAEVAAAYRDLGYEVLYMTTAPDIIMVGDQPMADAVAGWLETQGFPSGEGTHLWVWDNNYTAMRGLSGELERLTEAGASVDAAYTDNEDKAFAFKTSVPSHGVHTLGAAAGTSGTTPVPGDDMQAHATEVASLDAVCTSG